MKNSESNSKEYRRIYSFLRMVNCYVLKLINSINIDVYNEVGLFYTLIYYHLNKCFSLSKASYILLKLGYLNEVDILLRTFWETYINIIYISKNVKQRILLFQLDELNEHLESKIKIIPYYKEEQKIEIRNKINNIIQDRKIIIEELNKYNAKTDYIKFKWTHINIEEKSKKLKLKKEYIFLYSSWSEIVHPSSKGVTRYLKHENNKIKPILVPIKDDGMIPHRILFLCEYLVNFIVFIKDKYKIDKIGSLDLTCDIKKFTKYINELDPLIN